MTRRQVGGGPAERGRSQNIRRQHLDPAGELMPRPNGRANAVAGLGLGPLSRPGHDLERLEHRLRILGRALHLGKEPSPLRGTLGQHLKDLARRHGTSGLRPAGQRRRRRP